MRFTNFPSSNLVILVILFFLCLSPVFAASTDTLNPSQSLTFNQTLISAGAKFELGFFSRGNPKKYYAGIWYKDIPSDGIFLWVANRDSPSFEDSCILKLDDRANIVILDDGSHVRWNSSSDKSTAQNPVLQLLDSGNLVIREPEDQNPDHYIWQSFDHPTHTFIPGQKLGWNLVTGLNRFLTSWRAQDDPSSGNFTIKMDYHGDPEIYMRDGDQIIYRSGPWVGQRFSGEPEMATSNNGFTFTFHRGKKEVYYTYQLPPGGKVKSRVIITSQGKLERWTWVPNTSQWHIYWYATNDDCNSYKVCGSYGVCNTSAIFNCQCPQGFEPDLTQGWVPNKLNGCVRKTKLGCQSDDFLKMANMKLPESTTAFVDSGLDLHQCRERCKKNCSCTAFANLDVVQGVGNGCVLWTDDLIDLRVYVQGGQDLYLRLAASDLAKYKKSKGLFANKKLEAVLITVAVLAFILVIFLLSYLLHKKKKREWEEEAERSLWTKDADETDASSDLPFFTRNEIVAATDNFNSTNKLGKGGFGSVYKGKMENGQEIAVKKLAPNSGQGIQEFKNEVRLIARLQHRNLVKMVGCCIKGEEKMLIYEFMPNKSLDYFIFNEEKRSYLDWTKRFDIIMGIARGMLYLHQDSRLRIIHRDLKTSNILLDKDMIPKISDFGTARIFGNEQVQVNTTRVVGTYGYMAPEYALEGLMSVKSDVFSFGVLLLEVITGRKNSGFYPDNPSINLVGHVWELWKEGRTLEIVDPFSKDEDNEKELLIFLQIGLLCVQERADDRPTMSAVVFMLSNKVELPSPNRPAFIHRVKQSDADPSSSSPGAHSINELSVTAMVDGR